MNIKYQNNTRSRQEDIYRNLYRQHKDTTMAVSSESLAHKELRFRKVSEIFAAEDVVQVHDVGMGLGDFYPFLTKEFPEKELDYSGSDILEEFVMESRKKYPDCRFFCRDIAEQAYADKYDYLILSGVFHQRSEIKIPDFERFAQAIIKNSFYMARKGIAFNFVSPFVDYYQTNTYYCNFMKLINFINDDLGRFFTIHHNYALFEFTVFVYKESFISEYYPEPNFRKYFLRDLDKVVYVE